MLGYFPAPYEDELLYSVIARYAAHRGLVHTETINSALFGLKSPVAPIYSPVKLEYFTKQISHLSSMTVGDWVNKHTVYPAYTPFAISSHRSQVLAQIRSESVVDLYENTRAISCFSSTARCLRICKECYFEQKVKYGEAYWQRTLQIPGVYLCPKHKTSLWKTGNTISATQATNYKTAEHIQLISEDNTPFPSKVLQKLLILSFNMHVLLNASYNKEISREQWRIFYETLASRNGRKKERFNIEKIQADMVKYWTQEVLSEIDHSVINDPSCLRCFFRIRGKQANPLRHILILQTYGMNYNIIDVLNYVSRICPMPYINRSNKFLGWPLEGDGKTICV